ncbi:MAG: ROK family protein [Anaerolineae bacterium]|nr:ROK family protein [Anaerolineae bacterium]
MYAVIDLGGTNTSISLFTSPELLQPDQIAAFPTDPHYAGQLERVLSALATCRQRLTGIGMAIGVQLTADGLRVDETWTMPDYSKRPIVTDIASAIGVPVVAANDNVCAVIAETLHGSLRPWRRTAYLTVSTGTGAGIFLGDGSHSFAWLAQVGHHVVNMHGEDCVCGQQGCVQTVTGGQQFLRRFGLPAHEIKDESVWREVTGILAVAIVNLARITRVEAVCVGGGIGYNNSWIRNNLADRVQDRGPATGVRVLFPDFAEQAPVIGAALLAGKPDVTILR